MKRTKVIVVLLMLNVCNVGHALTVTDTLTLEHSGLLTGRLAVENDNGLSLGIGGNVDRYCNTNLIVDIQKDLRKINRFTVYGKASYMVNNYRTAIGPGIGIDYRLLQVDELTLSVFTQVELWYTEGIQSHTQTIGIQTKLMF